MPPTAVGTVYGAIGVFTLGVTLDYGLLAGAAVLAGTVARTSTIWSGNRRVRSMAASPAVKGHVSRGFETVREAFVDNFTRRRELGGACCAYHRGENIVDLWGGVRNKQTGEAWDQNTMVVVH